MGLPQVFTGNTMKKISFENGKKYCSYQDPFIGNDNILAMQAMLLGSLLGTNLTQVMLALSLGKNFAVYASHNLSRKSFAKLCTHAL